MTDSTPHLAADAAASPLPAIAGVRGAESRLRRGGLLRAAAGLAAATAMAGAQAGIVYSGALNTAFIPIFPLNGQQSTSDLASFVTIAANESLRMVVQDTKGQKSLRIDSYANDFHLATYSKSSVVQPFPGAGGDLISAALDYTSGSISYSGVVNAGTSEYFGFEFAGGKASPLVFGWLKFSYNGGNDWVLNSFAYENSGAGILTGDTGLAPAANGVPEPGTVPLVAAAGLAAALSGRRRRLAGLVCMPWRWRSAARPRGCTAG